MQYELCIPVGFLCLKSEQYLPSLNWTYGRRLQGVDSRTVC